MTDANSEGFPIYDERITENDRCVIIATPGENLKVVKSLSKVSKMKELCETFTKQFSFLKISFL